MDEPELYIFEPSDLPGADERRTEATRQRDESRRRYQALVEATVIAADMSEPTVVAMRVREALLDHRHSDGSDCHCSCHPSIPLSDFHDYGFDCPCQHTTDRRRVALEEWQASMDEFWASAEGMHLRAAREAEEAELAVWLDDHRDVVVESHGGLAPEQWRGSVGGRSFYFRERHGDWRIELDLRPSGRFAKVFRGVDADGNAVTEAHELTEGAVIAEGTTAVAGYGVTLTERVMFIVATIRTHVAREACRVHRDGLGDLARRLGTPPKWCPVCGAHLSEGRPA